MAERERASREKREEVDQKHRQRQRDSEPSIDQSLALDARPFSLTETPFYPRMEEHAEMLSRIPFTAQRHEFIMRLHQTYGNRYVQRLMGSMKVQAKLTVSSPDDVYEQEADRVAEAVTRSINTPVQQAVPEEEDNSSIQRKIEWVGGQRTHNKDLVKTVSEFADFGVTPMQVNNQEFPGAGNARTAIVPPEFIFNQVSEGKTALKVFKEPVNCVGYRMELPKAPPWQQRIAKDWAVSAIGMLAANRFEEKLKKYKGDGSQETLLKVKGLPSDTQFASLVETHEEHHVEELHEGIELILKPWDTKIKEFRNQNQIIEAESQDSAKTRFYEAVGGTPEQIGEEFVEDARTRGDEFHTTDEGSSPTVEEIKTTWLRKSLSLYWRHPLG